MKKIFFYPLIILPFALLFYLSIIEILGSVAFMIGLIVYIILYRPAIDFFRLRSRGVEIGITNMYKSFLSIHYKYYKELYF